MSTEFVRRSGQSVSSVCLALCAAVAGLLGASAHGGWTYDATAKTISNENGYVLTVAVSTFTDGTGAKVTGFRVDNIKTQGTGDIDFTGCESSAGYPVIYINNKLQWGKIPDLKRFIAPDVFGIVMEAFYPKGTNVIEEVELSDRFTSIPSRVFANAALRKLKPTTFPYVTSVGESAFAGSKIPTISLPTVTTMGDSVFNGCTNLTGDLDFPCLTTAGKCSFLNATKITSFRAPNLTEVRERLLYGCSELTNVVVGANCWTNFVGGAYASCPKLASITPAPVIVKQFVNPFDTGNTAYFAEHPLVIWGNAITSIPGSLMKNFPALKRVEITCDNIASIGDWALQSIADGAEIVWDGKAPQTISGSAFYGNSTVLKKIILKHEIDIDAWQSLPVFSPVSSKSKARADYPGKKTLGTINNCWLIKGWTNGLSVVIR